MVGRYPAAISNRCDDSARRGRLRGAVFVVGKGHTMKLARRKFLHLAAGAAALPAVSCAAIAQTYPARPITLIVPFPGGGPADAVGRLLAERMRGSLGQPIIIEDIGGDRGKPKSFSTS